MRGWVQPALGAGIVALLAYAAIALAPARGHRSSSESAAADAGPDAAPLAAPSAGDFAPDAGGGSPLLALGPLPSDAPQTVHLGVILVTYDGAQGGAPQPRKRADAEKLAKELQDQAKSDFDAAARRGDEGSSTDIGRVPRGVLEPELESRVFRLAPGEVSPVIDTPRGFWIARRLP